MISDNPGQDASPSFGYWVRRRRQALDLTQADLARRMNYALVTISKIERDERRPSRELAGLLADALQVPPAERATFLAAALGERSPDHMPLATTPLALPPAPPPAPARPAAHVHLPVAPTPFVGRAAELSQLEARLEAPSCRLITIAGPGGIGKTRLALRLAERAARDRFPDGIFFVAVEGLATAELLVASLCRALDFHPDAGGPLLPQLLAYLGDKQMLIVLDSFERLVAAAAVLVDLLAAAPGLKLLVTSWEALNLLEEWFYPLSGMLVYESEVFDPARPMVADGVKLFVACAQRVDADFDLARNYDHVVRICRLVDGIPLAIELAAGWLKSLSCREVEEELQRSLEFLTTSLRNIPPRHRSMRAVLERTWAYLPPPEQAAMGKLAIFEGGFRPAAAAAVAGVSAPVLASLVAKSMLQRLAPDRYRMHELLRQFALRRLAAVPPRPGAPPRPLALAAAHSRFYLQFLADRLPALEGPDAAIALDEIRAELDNVHAAWRFAQGTGPARGPEERSASGIDDPALQAKLAAALALAADLSAVHRPQSTHPQS